MSFWLLWAALLSVSDAVSFATSQTHFGDGYDLAFRLVPFQMFVAFWCVFGVAAAAAGVRLLMRRHVNLSVLTAGVAVWAGVECLFGLALLEAGGWPGLTGATKWWSAAVSGVVAVTIARHNAALPDRIVKVFEWIDEDQGDE